MPENFLTLVNHRSFYFSEKEVIYFGIAGNLTSSNTYADKYFLTKLEEKNPILYYFMVLRKILILIATTLKLLRRHL